MAGRGVLGCAGLLVGLLAAAVLGWMSLDLVLTVGAALSDGSAGAFAAPLIAHQLGQLLVVATLLWAVFSWVFGGAAGCPPLARLLLWIGAGLELVAWIGLPGGSRVSTWALLMAVVGSAAPLLLGRRRLPAPSAD